jgi:hypothetical protein
MQSVTLAIGDQGEIVVTATDEPPRFNATVWQDAVRADDLQQIVALGIDGQGDLAAGLDPARVHTVLIAIATVFPTVVAGQPDGTPGAVGRAPRRQGASRAPGAAAAQRFRRAADHPPPAP